MITKGLLARSLVAGLLQIATSTASAIIPLPHRDVCPPGSSLTQVFVTNLILEFPVSVNTFILENTILNINNIDITINNAPTQFITNFIGTTTVVSTSTVTTTTTVTPATTFIIQAVPTVAPAIRARQLGNNEYISPGGIETTDCGTAELFVFQNGVITTLAGAPISIDGSFGPFAPSSISGALTVQFTLVQLGGQVQIFAAGTSIGATFCKLPSGVVNIVSGGTTLPTGCVASSLFAINVAFCVNGSPTSTASNNSLSSTTSSSTASLSTGSSSSTDTAASGSSTTDTASSGSSATDTASTGASATQTGASGTQTGASDTQTGAPVTTPSGASSTDTAVTDTGSASSTTNLIGSTQTTPTTTGGSNTGTSSGGSSTGTSSGPTSTPTGLICNVLHSSLDTTTNMCVCDAGFTNTGTVPGVLICVSSVVCSVLHSSLDTTTNMCTCDAGYVNMGTVPGTLICVSTIVCTVLNSNLDTTTNMCVCDAGYSPTTVAGVLTLCTLSGP